MLNSLRKLRRNNMNSKYIKYAIGEIILVVIGILIALSINNWSQERSNRKYEMTMLEEVKKTMEADREFIQGAIPYLKSIQSNIRQLANMKLDPNFSRDSLETFLNNVRGYGITFTLNDSPYEAIKSGGLDKISNPKIRKSLSELYGFELAEADKWINEVHRRELFERNNMINDIFNPSVTPSKNNSITTAIYVDDPDSILKDPRFDKLLYTAGWPLPGTISRISRVLEMIDALQILIEHEINDN